MIPELAIAESHYEDLRQHLFRGGVEQAAILLCGRSRGERLNRLLVRELIPVPDEGFLRHESLALRLDGRFLVPHVKRARLEGWSLVFVHSHPFPGGAFFSQLDLEGERDLFGFWGNRLPGRPHANLVLAPEGFVGRWYSETGEIEPLERFLVVGRRVIDAGAAKGPIALRDSDVLDRQTRLLGDLAQLRLSGQTVGVVGLGGLGSIIADGLARFGVRHLVLWDGDLIEASNLSRLVGSERNDVEHNVAKVDIAARGARRVNPGIEITSYRSNLRENYHEALALRDCDVVFSCVDTHSVRALLNRFARQYLTPVVSLGTRVSGKPLGLWTGFDLLAPGGECLVCAKKIDPRIVADEHLSESDRAIKRNRGYLGSQPAPEPAVLSVNLVASGIGLTSYLRLLLGEEIEAALVVDLARARMRSVQPSSVPCYDCDPAGAAALGDLSPLLAAARFPATPDPTQETASIDR